jgi:hypothetical protein
MRHTLLFLFFVLLSTSQVWSQNLAIGQWYTHLPQRNARQVVDTGEEIFALTDVYYFSVNKNSGEISLFDKVWGLSDVQVDHLAYSEDNKALIVAYRNTNIDLIKDGNTIINVSDILRKSISGVKEINQIVIVNNKAYFATTFGIVVFDIEKEEFNDTYIIGDNGGQVSVLDLALTNDSIFAISSEGLKVATLSGSNLANYQNWQNIGAPNGMPTANGKKIEVLNDSIFALFGNTVYFGVNGVWNEYFVDTNFTITTIKATGGHLMILQTNPNFQGQLSYKDLSGNWQTISASNFNIPSDVVWDADGTLWVSDEYKGLIKYTSPSDVKPIVPNGPNSFSITGMSYNNGVLWAAPGGADANWNYNYNSGGFLSLENNFWGQYSEFFIPQLAGVLNIFAVESGPSTNKVYFGSFWDGLLAWDGTSLTKYNQANSTLEGAVGDEQRTRISALKFDEAGNLWIANHGAVSPLHVLSPEGVMTKLRTPQITLGSVSDIVIDDFGRKWVALPQSSTQGILVYDHGADIANTADDQTKILTSQVGNGALPNNDVIALASDKSGQIWVGTTQGIAVFYCAGSVLTQGCDAQRIIVSRDGFNGYLLENERINDILVDGADRKWVATNSGLWVFSPDGTVELAYYNEENSPLLSDNVIKLGYDGEHGIIYISTGRGLMSLRTEATEANDDYLNPIEVYPNPVRETYNGTIAIKGLPNNAEVRITDIAGELVYQTNAFGGQAVWDGRDYTGRKPKTGIYLVFSINEEGTASKPTKLLFIK